MNTPDHFPPTPSGAPTPLLEIVAARYGWSPSSDGAWTDEPLNFNKPSEDLPQFICELTAAASREEELVRARDEWKRLYELTDKRADQLDAERDDAEANEAALRQRMEAIEARAIVAEQSSSNWECAAKAEAAVSNQLRQRIAAVEKERDERDERLGKIGDLMDEECLSEHARLNQEEALKESLRAQLTTERTARLRAEEAFVDMRGERLAELLKPIIGKATNDDGADPESFWIELTGDEYREFKHLLQ